MTGKKVTITFVLIFLFIFPIGISSINIEDITFEHISVEQGLPNSSVFCILQDKQGFMWFGTQHGLTRYDGHNFKVYASDPRAPLKLSHNLVISLFEDSKGIMWVGTWGGGLNRFDRKKETFETFKHKPDDNTSLNQDTINAIFEDSHSNLWICTDNGLSRFNRATNSFKRYLYKGDEEGKPSPNSIKVNTILEKNEDMLLVGTEKGLFKYDKTRDNFFLFACKHGKNNPPNIKTIYCDQEEILWIGSEEGLLKFELKDGRLVHQKLHSKLEELNGKKITSILKAKELVWIGTRGDGLYLFDSTQNKLAHHRNSPEHSIGLRNNDIRTIYEGRAGLVWVGVNGGGVSKFDPGKEKFQLYRHTVKDPNSFNHNDVLVIRKSQMGGVWIGTKGGGFFRFEPETETFTNYQIDSDISKRKERHEIRALCEYKGKLWVGTQGAGLYTFDPKIEEFTKHVSDGGKDNENVLNIFKDKSDALWIGTIDNGLTKIGFEGKPDVNYRQTPGNYYSLSNNQVFAIYEDKRGLLWIGTGNGGLNMFDRKTEKFYHYKPAQNRLNSISHNFITAILEDQEGVLWIGTNGGGLNRFIRDSENFVSYTQKEGLPNDVIYDILCDKQGNLWISTNKGLSKFNPKTDQFINYTVWDGLQDYEFNRGAACVYDGGRLFFGGVKGFNIIVPDKLTVNSQVPPIMFTSYKKMNKKVDLDTPIQYVKKLDLSPKDSFISFEFAALNFSNPQENQYAYKLEPVNKEWILLGKKHDITLTNLEHGDYVLRVKGSNNDGVWNEIGTSIEITVHPFLWETLWFQVFSIIALISFGLGVVIWRIRTIEKKKQEAEKQKDELSKAYNLLQKQIQERIKAEKKLRESETRYRTLVETSPDAISLCDLKGNFEMVNKQAVELLGYSEKELKNNVKSIFRLLPRDELNKAKENAKSNLETGIARNAEFSIISKYGEKIPVEISTSLIKDDHGKPKYFLEIVRDIRERKKVEKEEKLRRERLVQIDKMVSLGTLVSGVAHELNNPLSAIKWNAEIFSRVWDDSIPILEKHAETDEDFMIAGLPFHQTRTKVDELILGFMEGVKRIKEINENLRNFSRPKDAGIREQVDINEIVRSSIKLTINMIHKATNNFSQDLADELPTFNGNFQKLEQVFINLILNACQALPESSRGFRISTEFKQELGHIEVTFKDQGIGIKDTDLKFITDPFFTTKRDEGGTGLGLSISMQIIQDHGGNMFFDSKEGQGTSVIIHLPVDKL
jgi:PAS domain S-box-containing protein